MTNSVVSVYHKRVVYHSFVIKIQCDELVLIVRLTVAQTNDAGGLMTNEDNPLQYSEEHVCLRFHKTSSHDQKNQIFGQKQRERD